MSFHKNSKVFPVGVEWLRLYDHMLTGHNPCRTERLPQSLKIVVGLAA